MGEGNQIPLFLRYILYLLLFFHISQYSSHSIHFTAPGVTFIRAHSKLSFYPHKVSYLSPQVMITPSFPALSLIMLMHDGTTLH